MTPILSGQQSSQKNVIPPPHTSTGNPTPASVPAPAPTKPVGGGTDLIDFGDTLEPPPSSAGRLEIEQMLQATSTPTPGPLADFQKDLRNDLPKDGSAPAALLRKDTDTRSVDEFVDAEG